MAQFGRLYGVIFIALKGERNLFAAEFGTAHSFSFIVGFEATGVPGAAIREAVFSLLQSSWIMSFSQLLLVPLEEVADGD